ncbi:hypothetical protein QR680_006905 [Steinernema hermaphroditum]|uniref:Cell cycle control protein 50A n=1 Tax=Steinernema hermaphroditum TaxID=289476 RepID=A0AA39HWV7_9BILA|nr:hypothetical protein QR680_006905 [Steinernema hermaphroditum]
MSAFPICAVGVDRSSLSQRISTKKKATLCRSSPFWQKLTQQRLEGSTPEPSFFLVVTVLFLTGLTFIPLGVVFLKASNSVSERKVPYHNEVFKGSYSNHSFELKEDIRGRIVVFYEIDNFFQSHRLYMQTIPGQQLLGNIEHYEDCTIYASRVFVFLEKVLGIGSNATIIQHKSKVPCGHTFRPMFHDRFSLKRITAGGEEEIKIEEADASFLHPSELLFHDPPLSEGEDLCSLMKKKGLQNGEGPYKFCERGFTYPPYLIWIRSAAFGSFRKPYGVVKPPEGWGLPMGNYTLHVDRNFLPAKSFTHLRIRFVLSTLSWMGGKNPFLGIIYIVVGTLCILAGLVISFVYVKYGIGRDPFRNFSD